MPPTGKYGTAEGRWAGMGPYYAMFPSAFADEVVKKYSRKGDTILDPFSGRGTAIFSATIAGRRALGIEVNPVGWIYSKTKICPAPKDKVVKRILDLECRAGQYKKKASALPEFFQRCFSSDVRAFLVCARSILDWRGNDVDRTAMAFILIHLHGKSNDSLSNQMRQTKAMSPQYAIDWWAERNMKPPRIAVGKFFKKKLDWRYEKGLPSCVNGKVILGDSASVLAGMKGNLGRHGLARPSLMITSPPYLGITNYHYDQWIRLWLLGGPPTDQLKLTQYTGKHQGKFTNLDIYKALLESVFTDAANLLRSDAYVYVRTDRREPTVSITRDALRSAFPKHTIRRKNQPLKGLTQTRLFGNGDPQFGEVDLILSPPC